MPVIEVKTQTRFMVLFTSGSLLTWGKPLDASPGHLPQIFVCYLPLLNYIPLSFTDILTMAEYAFFLQKADQWRKDIALMWEDISICPSLHWFQLPCHSQAELSSLNGLRA